MAKKPQPKMPKTKYWHFEIDFEKIGWLTIDVPKSSVNVLSSGAVTELMDLVTRFEDLIASDELAGVVLLSGKDSGFIAGADVSEFDSMADFFIYRRAPTAGIVASLEIRIPSIGTGPHRGECGFPGDQPREPLQIFFG